LTNEDIPVEGSDIGSIIRGLGQMQAVKVLIEAAIDEVDKTRPYFVAGAQSVDELDEIEESLQEARARIIELLYGSGSDDNPNKNAYSDD
jgi:hypothetical protein